MRDFDKYDKTLSGVQYHIDPTGYHATVTAHNGTVYYASENSTKDAWEKLNAAVAADGWTLGG